jgi:hypothetical protein
MPIIAPPTITAAPTPAPQRNDRNTFSDRVDAFVTWIIAAVGQFSAVASNVFNNATMAFTSATNAAASAAAADAASNASIWVSGTTYAIGNVRFSPSNFKSYRRKTAGAGTVDPATDTANWSALTDLTSVMVTSALGYTPADGASVTAVAKGGTGATTVAGIKAALAYTGNEVSALRSNIATDVETCKEMRWKNFGNNHTVFDASNATAPNGAAISNTNPTSPWTATYPTLMGWNGTQTYGVRVDVARYAETTAPVLNRVKTDGISYGAYGSISVSGVSNSWAGINFPDQALTFMTNAAQQGIFANNTTWLWFGDGAGNFTAAANVTAYSDERLKHNWRPLPDDFVARWALVKHGIYDRVDNQMTQVGLSAQAVQAILPHAIVTDHEGILTLNYGAAAGVATVKLAEKAMQQEALIRQLCERIEALEKK